MIRSVLDQDGLSRCTDVIPDILFKPEQPNRGLPLLLEIEVDCFLLLHVEPFGDIKIALVVMVAVD